MGFLSWLLGSRERSLPPDKRVSALTAEEPLSNVRVVTTVDGDEYVARYFRNGVSRSVGRGRSMSRALEDLAEDINKP